MSEIDELQREYKRLAKQADTRMKRLEKYEQEEHFKNVTKWAYAKAKKDVKSIFGSDGNFERKLPDSMTKAQMMSSINKVKEFIESPTSTKSGIKKTYQSRAKTLNKMYGMSLTWQQWATIFESGKWDKWDAKMGYRTAMADLKEEIASSNAKKKSKANKKKATRQAIEKEMENPKNMKVSDEEFDQIVKKVTRKRKKKVSDLKKGK